MKTRKRFLKNLVNKLEECRIILNKNNFKSVNLYFQDESRFGLITKQKRVITAKGIKAIGTYKHSYLYNWLWRSFSPLTGESFCMTTQSVCKELFIKYLEDFSNHKPTELKIIIIDNAAFHSTKDVIIPQNIFLLPIPPYCPELNPAEKIWQWMKDKIAMKIYNTLAELNQKMEELIKTAENELIKSITGYEFYIKAFYSIFKV
ncbi:transposase [Flavobacterium columnare]|uniref:IS630 family transposase n=2 Tax=Flavobacterium columnare TaxID=996 RepID=UPI00189647A9|nr:IS630 family transposase [Flavobacterium columnare]MBF6654528.1 transposase [Flavobacterium columnare]